MGPSACWCSPPGGAARSRPRPPRRPRRRAPATDCWPSLPPWRPTPTPSPSTSTSPGTYPAPPNPGPNAAIGKVLNNGAPLSGITIQVGGRSTTTDAQGLYRFTGLPAGTYQAYYYNPSDRNKIGYWRSRPMTVDGARVTLPYTFQWLAPIQPVRGFYFRIHSQPYTSFKLIYQSSLLPGTARAFTWNGGSTTLDPNHRYFWGVKWDWGELGEGGNLYQPVYMNK